MRAGTGARTRLLLGGGVLLLALVAATAGWMLWQARASMLAGQGRAAPGIEVAGIDLSGMRLDRVEHRLHELASETLDAEHVVLAVDVRQVISPRSLGADDNVAAVLAQITTASRSLDLWDWVGVRWAGQRVAVDAELGLAPVDPQAVDALVAELAEQVDRPAVDAEMAYDDDAITFHAHQDGHRLDVEVATATILAALDVTTAEVGADVGRRMGGAPIELPVATTRATSTLGDTGQVLYLDQSEHTLQLFDGGEQLGEWVVATGARGFGTPTGEYWVEEKRENPTWGNPAPNGWGRSMPAFIGPGPNNPLGLRAINWGGTDHIRFHGTTDVDSLGTDASHGCVRMANDDVVELFDLVRLDARIISVD